MLGAAVAVLFVAAIACVAIILIRAGGVAAYFHEFGVLFFGKNLFHLGVVFLESGFEFDLLFFLSELLI